MGLYPGGLIFGILRYHIIKVYFSVFQYHFGTRGYRVSICDMVQLYYLLQGIRYMQGPSFSRLCCDTIMFRASLLNRTLSVCDIGIGLARSMLHFVHPKLIHFVVALLFMLVQLKIIYVRWLVCTFIFQVIRLQDGPLFILMPHRFLTRSNMVG